MKKFDEETFTNILSAKGIDVTGYVLKRRRGDQERLLLRTLQVDDHSKGVLELMCDDVTGVDDRQRREALEEYLALRESCPGSYYTLVVEDLKKRKILACGTLIVEQKFIHETAYRGRIENLVVDPVHRRRKIGSVVLGMLTFVAEKLSCYKTTLDCDDEAALFCEKMKYLREPGQNSMLINFNQNGKDKNSPRPRTPTGKYQMKQKL